MLPRAHYHSRLFVEGQSDSSRERFSMMKGLLVIAIWGVVLYLFIQGIAY